MLKISIDITSSDGSRCEEVCSEDFKRASRGNGRVDFRCKRRSSLTVHGMNLCREHAALYLISSVETYLDSRSDAATNS